MRGWHSAFFPAHVADTHIRVGMLAWVCLCRYVDKEASGGHVVEARRLFERCASMKWSTKKMRGLLKKWYLFEEANGSPATLEHVKAVAKRFVADSQKSKAAASGGGGDDDDDDGDDDDDDDDDDEDDDDDDDDVDDDDDDDDGGGDGDGDRGDDDEEEGEDDDEEEDDDEGGDDE
jgi:hypothetical protein